jgi:hypothetical protein
VTFGKRGSSSARARAAIWRTVWAEQLTVLISTSVLRVPTLPSARR